MFQTTFNGKTLTSDMPCIIDMWKDMGLRVTPTIVRNITITVSGYNLETPYTYNENITAEMWNGVMKLMFEQGRKIAAIKLARALYCMGLGEAKTFVEEL